MKKYLLTICIPTYNRSLVYDDVIQYLSVNDNRFCVRVQDNCSTNGLWEKLNTIHDDRLILRQNKENIGGIPNQLAVLYGNSQSEYSMIFVDKDFVYLDKLSCFLDFLDKNKPAFGYTYLEGDVINPEIITYSRGNEALNNMAYRCDHPTGRFFKSDLITCEMGKDYFGKIDKKFDFVLDVINAHLAISYDATLYKESLIRAANKREYPIGKTLTYNENNVYFSKNMRLMAYELFIKDIKDIVTDKECYSIAMRNLFKRFSGLVTLQMRRFFQQKSICEHYNIQTRVVTFYEQAINLKDLYNLHRLYDRTTDGLLSICFGRVIQILVYSVKELFVKPEQKDFLI